MVSWCSLAPQQKLLWEVETIFVVSSWSHISYKNNTANSNNQWHHNNGKRITLNCKALLFQAVVVHISLLHFPDLPESQGTCCHLLLTGAQGHDTWTPTCV